ncbi:bacterioferritin-associated ferredoxin [Marinospirillum celere]|uniref:Bacterioferritin-associated ferredoxin n=1 Tax=Marinospirillum celere TaxID=1122252 RepID=A0A1I1FYR8_9GAMM|nr:(2Fe-2S)-binding protein [Marinospirillum celere]SFC02193.1 bacterioferritin-associated ferredoxin [Marinospirillum celere]
MYVCICKGITDQQIKTSIAQGAGCMRDLYKEYALGSQCGKCVCTAKQLLNSEKQACNGCEIVAA